MGKFRTKIVKFFVILERTAVARCKKVFIHQFHEVDLTQRGALEIRLIEIFHPAFRTFHRRVEKTHHAVDQRFYHSVFINVVFVLVGLGVNEFGAEPAVLFFP